MGKNVLMAGLLFFSLVGHGAESPSEGEIIALLLAEEEDPQLATKVMQYLHEDQTLLTVRFTGCFEAMVKEKVGFLQKQLESLTFPDPITNEDRMAFFFAYITLDLYQEGDYEGSSEGSSSQTKSLGTVISEIISSGELGKYFNGFPFCEDCSCGLCLWKSKWEKEMEPDIQRRLLEIEPFASSEEEFVAATRLLMLRWMMGEELSLFRASYFELVRESIRGRSSLDSDVLAKALEELFAFPHPLMEEIQAIWRPTSMFRMQFVD